MEEIVVIQTVGITQAIVYLKNAKKSIAMSSVSANTAKSPVEIPAIIIYTVKNKVTIVANFKNIY